MDDNTTVEEKMPENTPKRAPGSTAKKIFIIVAALAVVVFLVILILIGGASAMLLDSKPIAYKPATPDMEAVASVQQKITPIYQEMFRCKPEDAYKLTFTGKEINTIIANVQIMGSSMSSIGGSKQFSWPAGLNVKYEKDCFNCEYSYEIPFPTPFGKYINLRGKVIPQLKSGNIKFVFEDTKAGDFDLPSEVVTQKVTEGLNERNEEIVKLVKIVSDLYVDDKGLLHVTIYPYALRVYVMDKMKQRMEKNAESQKKLDDANKKNTVTK